MRGEEIVLQYSVHGGIAVALDSQFFAITVTGAFAPNGFRETLPESGLSRAARADTIVVRHRRLVAAPPPPPLRAEIPHVEITKCDPSEWLPPGRAALIKWCWRHRTRVCRHTTQPTTLSPSQRAITPVRSVVSERIQKDVTLIAGASSEHHPPRDTTWSVTADRGDPS